MQHFKSIAFIFFANDINLYGEKNTNYRRFFHYFALEYFLFEKKDQKFTEGLILTEIYVAWWSIVECFWVYLKNDISTV